MSDIKVHKVHEFTAGEAKFRIVLHEGPYDKLVIEQAGIDALGHENWHFVGRGIDNPSPGELTYENVHELMHVLLFELANQVEKNNSMIDTLKRKGVL
jgi:hypothetical protein